MSSFRFVAEKRQGPLLSLLSSTGAPNLLGAGGVCHFLMISKLTYPTSDHVLCMSQAKLAMLW